MEARLVLEKELHAGRNQEGAKDVHHPTEPPEQRRPCEDERGAHHEDAEDPKEQDAVLVFARYPERRENDEEDEDIVDRERLLDEVAGEEFEAAVGAVLPGEEGVEAEGESDPQDRPRERLAKPDHVGGTVKGAEIEREEAHDDRDEAEPERGCADGDDV